MNAHEARAVGREGVSGGVAAPPVAFGLRSVSKIRDLHLNRLCIRIRPA
jgi:hypothetical protein